MGQSLVQIPLKTTCLVERGRGGEQAGGREQAQVSTRTYSIEHVE